MKHTKYSFILEHVFNLLIAMIFIDVVYTAVNYVRTQLLLIQNLSVSKQPTNKSVFLQGLCFVMPTATITDLQYRTSTSEDSIGNIYRARYGGYVVGCFAGGFLFNCYNRQFLLFLALLATAIGVLVMPFCRVLATLMACTCVTGVTMGLLDTGGNVWLLDLWGRKSAPFMQTMHFCFGLGALVAPLVAQPFVGSYNQIGARGLFNESRNLLPPMSPRFPGNPYGQKVKRDLTQIAHNISTQQPLLNRNITRTTRLGFLNMNTSTTPPSATTTKLPPKKPLYANGEKQFDVWERPAPHAVTTTTNLTMNSMTSTTAANATTSINMNSTSTPVVLSAPTEATRANAVSQRYIMGKPETKTTPTSVTNELATSPPPASVQATIGVTNCSFGNKGSTIKKTVTPSTDEISTSSTLSPAIASILPTGAASVPPSSTTPVGKSTAQLNGRVSPLEEAWRLNDSLKALHQANEPERESTTKATSSTVPTQETVKATAVLSEASFNTTKKHHSMKKVLPDNAEQVSWIEATKKKIQESDKFEIAYGILAAYVLVVSVIFLIFLCMNPREGRSKQEEELDDTHVAQASLMRLPLIILMCSFFFLYMGIEVAVGETLKPLLKRGPLVTGLITGEQLVYVFWGSFALARGVSIFISMKASYRTMLITDLLLCLSAALILVLGAQQSGLLVAGVIILATGMASIIPTLFIWLERCTQVTNRLSALLILSAAVGEMIIPELVSAFTRSSSPMALMYIILGVVVLCSVNFVALW